MPAVWWGSKVEVHKAIARLHRLGKLKDVEKQGALSRIFDTVGALLIRVGVGVGLLFAPASGEKARADIAGKVSDFGDKVREQAGRTPPSATGTYGELGCAGSIFGIKLVTVIGYLLYCRSGKNGAICKLRPACLPGRLQKGEARVVKEYAHANPDTNRRR